MSPADRNCPLCKEPARYNQSDISRHYHCDNDGCGDCKIPISDDNNHSDKMSDKFRTDTQLEIQEIDPKKKLACIQFNTEKNEFTRNITKVTISG